MQYSQISRRTLLKVTGLSIVTGSALSVESCANHNKQLDLKYYLTKNKHTLTFILPRSEMGQDIVSTFAILIAEELDAPLHMIDIKLANASPDIPNQMTVGSSSTRSWWMKMRQIGAITKALLIQQAAIQYGKPESDFISQEGFIFSRDKSIKVAFGDLLEKVQIPDRFPEVKLKDSSEFKLIGQSQHSIFNKEKSTGEFQYLGDFDTPASALKLVSIAYKANWTTPSASQLQNLLEKFGLTHAFRVDERIGSFDRFIFLCHEKTWPLLKAKRELEAELKNLLSKEDALTPSDFEEKSKELVNKQIANSDLMQLVFETPAIPHAPMETPNGSILLSDDLVEVWAPTQAPDHAQSAIAKRLNIASNAITLHSISMGGGFGRKRYTDYLEELTVAARELYKKGISHHLTLLWTREDDLIRERYRPATLQIVKWSSKSPDHIDLSIYEGYAGAKESDFIATTTDLPNGMNVNAKKASIAHHFSSGIWRSVHHGYNAFALCSAIDEMCAQQDLDPISYYLNHPITPSIKSRAKAILSGRKLNSERILEVIERVQSQSSWNDHSEPTSALGFSAYSVFGSHIALVTKLRISPANELEINHIWAAVDCGQPINPDKIKAQIEGGILFGLSACLYGNMLENKDQVMLNFDNQPVLRMPEAPRIEISLVKNSEPPTGTGELGVPVIAPAVTNAIRRLTNFRFTRLPLLKEKKVNFDNGVNTLDAKINKIHSRIP